MNRTAWLQDRRMQKFRDVLSRWERGALSMMEAGELLGMSERQFRRYRDRYEEEGLEGLIDRRLGKPSPKRVPARDLRLMLELYRDCYRGWNVKHFHEHLVRDHNFQWGYSWVKTQLHTAGLVDRAKRRGAHRRKRERKPCAGMMLHQDGSRTAWLDGQPMLDLIVTMDDATSTIYSAFLVGEEGTASTFQALLEVFCAHGLPSSLYSDRGSHYFFTPKAGEAVDKERLTQVGRALQQLGIAHIPAYSPEARGRSERMFGTLQDRLPKELKLAGINDMESANRFIREVYLPAHNARFAKACSAARERLCGRCASAVARYPVRAGGAHRGARQHRRLRRPAPAIAAKPAAAALRQGARAGASLSRWRTGRVPRPAPLAIDVAGLLPNQTPYLGPPPNRCQARRHAADRSIPCAPALTPIRFLKPTPQHPRRPRSAGSSGSVCWPRPIGAGRSRARGIRARVVNTALAVLRFWPSCCRPPRTSTGAVTIAADLTIGGSSVRPDPEFVKRNRRQRSTSSVAASAAQPDRAGQSAGGAPSRARKRRQSWLTRPWRQNQRGRRATFGHWRSLPAH